MVLFFYLAVLNIIILYLERNCICTLISMISLSDMEMDYLRIKSSHLGVYCIDIQ